MTSLDFLIELSEACKNLPEKELWVKDELGMCRVDRFRIVEDMNGHSRLILEFL